MESMLEEIIIVKLLARQGVDGPGSIFLAVNGPQVEVTSLQ